MKSIQHESLITGKTFLSAGGSTISDMPAFNMIHTTSNSVFQYSSKTTEVNFLQKIGKHGNKKESK